MYHKLMIHPLFDGILLYIIQSYNTPSFYLPSSYSSVCQLSAIQMTAFSDGNVTAQPRSF